MGIGREKQKIIKCKCEISAKLLRIELMLYAYFFNFKIRYGFIWWHLEENRV